MVKDNPYIIPFLVLVIGTIIIVSFVFANIDFTYNKDKSIALMISAFGLLFGIFQVLLNNNLQTSRSKAALRHAEYKEFIKFLNSVSDLMNNSMIFKPDVESLVSTLLNKKNEMISFIRNNNSYLFEGIRENDIIKETLYLIEDLCVQTDKYRFELDKLGNLKEKASIYRNPKQEEWHNSVRETLIKYNEMKHEASIEIQKYLH